MAATIFKDRQGADCRLEIAIAAWLVTQEEGHLLLVKLEGLLGNTWKSARGKAPTQIGFGRVGSGVQNGGFFVLDDVEASDCRVATGAHQGRDLSHMPAVVLLDLNLPKLSGLDILRHLRSDERTRTLPVVILTSSREEQDLINGYRFGCNNYASKPVDFVRFAEAVRQVGLYWLAPNGPPPTRA